MSQRVRMGYFLPCSIRVDDAHEGFQSHVYSARIMRGRGNIGFRFRLYGEAHLIGSVRMSHDGDGGWYGREVSRPTDFQPADFR